MLTCWQAVQPAIDKKWKKWGQFAEKYDIFAKINEKEMTYHVQISAKSSEDQKKNGHHFCRGPVFRKI